MFELYSMNSGDVVGPVLAIAVLVFLAFEFVIGATLYERAHTRSPSTIARVLSFVSYAIAALLVLSALGVAFAALFVA